MKKISREERLTAAIMGALAGSAVSVPLMIFAALLNTHPAWWFMGIFAPCLVAGMFLGWRYVGEIEEWLKTKS